MRTRFMGVALAIAVLALAAGKADADPTVVAAGDIACDPADPSSGGTVDPARCQDRKTADLVAGAGAAAVLALGDEQYCCGSIDQFAGSYDSSWGRFKALTRPVAGNHEYRSAGAAGYFDYFNGPGNLSGAAGDRDKGYYSFDVGAWHVVALNSNCQSIAAGPAVGGCAGGSPQEEWLRADLASHPAACTLAFWHHPRFSSGGNSSFMGAIWGDLYAAGAELVLSGHQHIYERFPPLNERGRRDSVRGVREIVVGTGGHSFTTSLRRPTSEVRQNDTFGVLELSLHRASYLWQFVPEPGKSFTDSGLGLCHGAASGVAVPATAVGVMSVGRSGTLQPAGPSGGVRCTIVGSPLDDVLIGTPGNDVICGLGGNDRIDGLAGHDVVVGGDGDDRILAGSGGKRVYGGPGDDWIFGGAGSDRLYGGPGHDRLVGYAGTDALFGERGRDRLEGGSGHDRLDGGRGPDLLDGGLGADSLQGGRGSDVLSGDLGGDRMNGGGGDDRLRGGGGRDRLNGARGRDRLNVADGRGGDTVRGGGGRDTAIVDRRDRTRGVERVRRLSGSAP